MPLESSLLLPMMPHIKRQRRMNFKRGLAVVHIAQWTDLLRSQTASNVDGLNESSESHSQTLESYLT